MHTRTRTVIRLVLLLPVLIAALRAQTLYVPSGTGGIGTSSNGNVGIGTSNPQAGLDVTNGIHVHGGPNYATAGAGLELLKINDSLGTISMINGPDRSERELRFYGTPITFYQAGAERLRIDLNGNIGIGTAAPSNKFSVGSSSLILGSQVQVSHPSGDWGVVIKRTANDAGNANFALLKSRSESATPIVQGDSIGRLTWHAVTNANGSTQELAEIGVMNVSFDGTNADGYLHFDTKSQGGSLVERMRIDQVGNVGIGTTNPQSTLHVSGNASGELTLLRLSNMHGNEGTLDTVGIKLGIETNGYWAKGAIYFERTGGYGVGKMYFANNPNVDSSDVTKAHTRLTIDTNGNVGIGTTNPTQKLSVNGTVRAKEVIVDTGWSDYVFAQNYRLAPLTEVETHIKTEGHLPGIPSAQEVAERGISLGEMQSKLLAKIEELTLHQIAQEKRIAKLEAENAALRAK